MVKVLPRGLCPVSGGGNSANAIGAVLGGASGSNANANVNFLYGGYLAVVAGGQVGSAGVIGWRYRRRRDVSKLVS